MADFDVSGFAQEAGGGGLVAGGGGHDDALGAVDELGVGGLDVDHEVAEDGSLADHDGGGDHVEDELGGGAGFHAGAAGEDLGAGGEFDGELGGLGRAGGLGWSGPGLRSETWGTQRDLGHAGETWGGRCWGGAPAHDNASFGRVIMGHPGGCSGAGQGDGEGALLVGEFEGAEDVGGSAAGGYAEDDVFGRERVGGEVGGALIGGVFRLFRGFAQGGVAAGDEADEEAGRDREGGRALASVEDAEAAAGAGADIEQPATPGETLGDGVDGLGDGGQGGADGGGDGGVFVVDGLKYVERGELVDVGGAGVRGFGGEVGEVFVRHGHHGRFVFR